MKRLKLENDFLPQSLRVEPQFAYGLDCPCPLVFRLDHFTLPDIFAQHQKKIASFQVIAELQVSASTIDVEAAYRAVEIGNSEGGTWGRNDGKGCGTASLSNRLALRRINLQRIGKDVNRVDRSRGSFEFPQPYRPSSQARRN